MDVLGLSWDSVEWGVVVSTAIALAALAVSVWTKWSEGRHRREAERARRSADLVASVGGSEWEPPPQREPGHMDDGTHGSTTYIIRLHNAGQMSAGDIVLWAEVEESGHVASGEVRVPPLSADERTETRFKTEHRWKTPLLLRARWTDGNGQRERNLMILEPFS